MKLSKKLWNLYCSSPDHQYQIGKFQDAYDESMFTELLFYYNQSLGFDISLRTELSELLYCYNISDFENVKIKDESEAGEIFHSIVTHGLSDTDGYIIFPGDYKGMMKVIPDISLWLSSLFPEYYFPYLYLTDFSTLTKVADVFDIQLPPIPKKTNYEARCMYYWELCKVFNVFRKENNMTMPEFSSFIYDFVPNYLIEDEKAPNLSRHFNLWISGGIPNFGLPEECYWGCNSEAKPGDLLLIYQIAPISGITAMYLILTNGEIDPFGTYHCFSKVKKLSDIPCISLRELQAHPYFNKHPLVRRKFQGVNGTALSASDYYELRLILKDKEFDNTILPNIEKFDFDTNNQIKVERDVEEKLLIPLLSDLGLTKGKDYIRQLPIHAGRGSRIYPDFALFYNDSESEPTADILIEAKFHIKNIKELIQAFVQAKSYANLLQSNTLILCDKERLIVYPKGNGFDRNYYEEFFWSELSNPDILSKFKKYIDKKQ